MRQGNDMGTQYRSALYWTTDAQREIALRSRDAYQAALSERGRGQITTELAEAGTFYPAEEYHQQYLQKNPDGYCGLGGTGVSCPVGAGVTAAPDCQAGASTATRPPDASARSQASAVASDAVACAGVRDLVGAPESAARKR
jgi:hypothetical protein